MIDIEHTVKIAQEYLFYKLTAKSTEGHGIHSPFVYHFVKDVIRDYGLDANLQLIEKFRQELQNSQNFVGFSSHGAGSIKGSRAYTLGKLIRTSSIKPKLGAFLYRLCKWLDAKTILEIGTSIGISTLYFAKACPQAKIITLEGDRQRAYFAKKTFDAMDCKNVELHQGDFDFSLFKIIDKQPKIDLVLFDGNHKPEPTLKYFKLCSELKHENSVFVFDDIRWSKEMYKTWQIISDHKSVSISFDLFNFGVILFRKGIPKQHFTINL
jgi:predicted O-methyltransferase YrrM